VYIGAVEIGFGDLPAGNIFRMNGGTISGNAAKSGGGVYVDSYGLFHMNGGIISENMAEGDASGRDADGGGVYVGRGGLFNMNGGTISGNAAMNSVNEGNGGGVFVTTRISAAPGGTFNMSGGIIRSNYAGESGGGVYVDRLGTNETGIFIKTGGTIFGSNLVNPLPPLFVDRPAVQGSDNIAGTRIIPPGGSEDDAFANAGHAVFVRALSGQDPIMVDHTLGPGDNFPIPPPTDP
jgi:hypothetical protein